MSTTPTSPAVAPQCPSCAAPLAGDQRYCLECGEPRPGARRPLPAALRRTGAEPVGAAPARASGLSLTAGLAGLACLLLAVGVGVLIGRSGGEPAPAPPITISGAAAGAADGATPSAAAPVGFHSDWPAGRDGWTVALQLLPKAGTDAAAVARAKTAASGRGAADVGALDSDAHRSLTGGSYVVYSGVFGSRAAATAARGRLAKSFKGARVVRVTDTAPATAARHARATSPSKRRSGAKQATSGSGGGDSTKSAFEKSKKLPKTLGTGGKPPPKDNKPAAGGAGFEEIK